MGLLTNKHKKTKGYFITLFSPAQTPSKSQVLLTATVVGKLPKNPRLRKGKCFLRLEETCLRSCGQFPLLFFSHSLVSKRNTVNTGMHHGGDKDDPNK